VPPPYRTPPFDCSIQQLLSPVPYTPHLPFLENSVDPNLLGTPSFSSPTDFIKTEEDDDTVGDIMRDFLPSRQSTVVVGNSILTQSESEYVNPQFAWQYNTYIPQTLSPVTSPLLENNPAFRHLFFHFIRNTCHVLVPYDDLQNPFRTVLAQMALHPSAQHLLAALLASSAAHRAGCRKESPPEFLIKNLLQMTLAGLRKALANPSEASQETTLATAIALSSYNIISSDVALWRVHLGGAREIILHRRRTGSLNHRDNSITAFLLKWFAYLDVIAGASGLTLKEHNYDSAVSLIEDVTETHRADSWEPSKFDTFTGFTSRLLPLLLRIGKLAHDQRVAALDNIDMQNDEEYLNNIVTLEESLQEAEFDNTNIVLPPGTFSDMELATQLRACNEAFHHAARLHIQRRLRNMTSEQVRPVVEQVFKAIERVPVNSGPEISLLFPLFSAGVEATGNLRDYARYRMVEMEKIGIGNVGRAKKVMFATWEQTDLNGEVRWEDVMEGMGWDLSLA
jgi:Fungal specific transcription factor domain